MQHHFSGDRIGMKWPVTNTMGTEDTALVLRKLLFIGANTWRTESLSSLTTCMEQLRVRCCDGHQKPTGE